MIITEPPVASARLLGLGSKLYPSNILRMLNKDLTRFIQFSYRIFLEYSKIMQAKERLYLFRQAEANHVLPPRVARIAFAEKKN